MTIFDKLSGLAQKAKDSVVSKTVLSMDKRLEHSLSDNLNTQNILMRKISTYGLPSNVSVVAFDSVAGLLAVSGNAPHGYVKVFGKGISTTIMLPNQTSVKYLQFKTGYPLLVVIDKKNVIFTIDLRTKAVRHIIPAQEIITSLEYCTGSDWLFIGYANGYVDVFDIHLGKFTNYQIHNLCTINEQQSSPPPQQQQQQQQPASETASPSSASASIKKNNNNNNVVVALHMHPTELDTLLIGYESGVYLWNIREKCVKRHYSLLGLEENNPYRHARLTCLAWNPSGSRFVAGYDDGCIHLWDVRNESKPTKSRKLFQTFLSPTEDAVPTEPIYQMAWYYTEATRKSYLVVAGGIDSNDIQGLSVLEFDLDSDAKESKKQTIMPLPVDLSHFVILGTANPFNPLQNPFAIAVVGADHCLRVYSLDHTGMVLKLPPALEFLGPDVTNACHLPQLPDAAFKKLAAMTQGDRATRWLPITGGIAGPEHVYHIDSNDLLLTIHKGEVIKFWDASYTALRPLSHLTLYCLNDLGSNDNFLCCLDVNKSTGDFSIGFVDGSVLVYEYIGDPADPPSLDQTRSDKFIASCDDTLKEISDLLEDMKGDGDDDVDHETQMNEGVSGQEVVMERGGEVASNEQSINSDANNPFLNNNDNKSQPVSQQQQQEQPPLPSQGQQQQSPPPPTTTTTTAAAAAATSEPVPSLPPRPRTTETERMESTVKSIFTRLNKTGHSAGFYATLKISLKATITSVVSVGESILALASVDGVITVLDIHKQIVLLSVNITDLDMQNSQASQPQTPNTEIAQELSEADPNKHAQKKPATITSVKFFNSYSSSKVTTTSTQLIVGLSNGHVYQFDLFNLFKSTATPFNNDAIVKLHPASNVLETHIIDLKGRSQLAIQVELNEPETPLRSPLNAMNSQSNNNTIVASPESSTDDLASSKSPSVTSVGSSSGTNSGSKRMAAMGKSEYRQQENPHLAIYTCPTSVHVVLAGFNVKLYNKSFKDIQIIKSQVIKYHDISCFAMVLSNGTLVLLSLPHLEPILELQLPPHHLPEKLAECSLSEDGRLVIWTGKYEMEQYAFMPTTAFQIGESVILFDSQKGMPSHPTLQQQQQQTKKTWLNTVAGAFQKDPLTLSEMDQLMGRVPLENRKAEYKKQYQQQQQQQQQSESSSSGPGGVFSELGDKMNERGERLNELNKKFEDMNAASGDFLKAIKDYNERQSKKKWWEF